MNGNNFLGGLPAYGAALNALGSWAASTAAAVETNATNAAGAAAIAMAAANFKGAWPGLSGSLSIPASASHDGAVWLLVEDVANVTAHEPGVSTKWLRMFALGVARFAVVEVADDYVGSARQWVEQTAPDKTVWMPESPQPGTEFGFGIKGAVTGAILHFNGEPFEGHDIGFIEWDAPPDTGRPFLYVNSETGWRVV
ncbi:MAG: hypothetical protein KJZ96_15675 [Rhodocyclaceae bacterium]|nr:hypothetical protein [Rhodocyclaceae bacterium]